ncbi:MULTISPECIES: YebG family protein [Vibrio]|jgi:dsDNA-binding SOS-regulon protein|uniref:Multidrug DMT transporter permease n=2 Tax=Vibrio TaxID=662 RepID=A0A2J8GV66_VIBDI|nr:MULTISPECIES: YebG family protein [Vibrio]MCF7361211.1 YebG family protein [Vibrio sp. A1-b2]MDW6017927.1 YebG family protein [Vibrio plantisponsor]NNM39664.1 YebG family protein [Vibrio plantisponsor]PNH80316.1 multidrug DMT transporter permease [Vibrio diazotrophicus]PNH89914.1 multidrug DMT transporter permease [Vibrio diazotrophicus]
MAVIVKYVVERNGEEKMTFTSKAEADAYDKMLDMADELFELIGKSELIEDEAKTEELAMFLAQNKEDVLIALGAKRKPTPPTKKPKAVKTEDAVDDAA